MATHADLTGRIQAAGIVNIPRYYGPTNRSGLNTLTAEGSISGHTVTLQCADPDGSFGTVSDANGVNMAFTTLPISVQFAVKAAAFRFSTSAGTSIDFNWKIR